LAIEFTGCTISGGEVRFGAGRHFALLAFRRLGDFPLLATKGCPDRLNGRLSVKELLSRNAAVSLMSFDDRVE
jgi:hypothetical protein